MQKYNANGKRGDRKRGREFRRFVAERGEEERCVICLDAFEDPGRVVVTACGHAMHQPCWLRNNQTQASRAMEAGLKAVTALPHGKERKEGIEKVVQQACRIIVCGKTCPVCRADDPTRHLLEGEHDWVARAVRRIQGTSWSPRTGGRAP